jgi:hypothetical protein
MALSKLWSFRSHQIRHIVPENSKRTPLVLFAPEPSRRPSPTNRPKHLQVAVKLTGERIDLVLGSIPVWRRRTLSVDGTSSGRYVWQVRQTGLPWPTSNHAFRRTHPSQMARHCRNSTVPVKKSLIHRASILCKAQKIPAELIITEGQYLWLIHHVGQLQELKTIPAFWNMEC